MIAVVLLVAASCDPQQRSPTAPTPQLSDEQNAKATPIRTGKYQLLQASVESRQGKRLQTVLRIDTETGQTWVLLPEEPPKWQPISDPDLNKSDSFIKPGGALEKLLKEKENTDIDPLNLLSPEDNAKRRKEREK